MTPVAIRPSDWHLDALCAQVDPELFFPEKGRSGRAAKTMCNRCEVKDRCLAEALENKERFGVWGGTTPQERLMLLRSKDPDFVWDEDVIGPEGKSGRKTWAPGQTHCSRGHELTPENVMKVKYGRRCRACKRMADDRIRRSRREWREEQRVDRSA